MKTWLFNPFKFIAGNKALLLGIAAMLVTSVVCFIGKLHLDGVIDVHEGRQTSYWLYFAEPFIDWLCLVIPLYFFGRSLSVSAIRFIDVGGTSALARYPVLFVVLLSIPITSVSHTDDPQKFLHDILTNPGLMLKLAALGLLVLPFIVWTVVLMYNAYSLSANLKGPKAIWSFIASFLIAEILSKVIFSLLI